MKTIVCVQRTLWGNNKNNIVEYRLKETITLPSTGRYYVQCTVGLLFSNVPVLKQNIPKSKVGLTSSIIYVDAYQSPAICLENSCTCQPEIPACSFNKRDTLQFMEDWTNCSFILMIANSHTKTCEHSQVTNYSLQPHFYVRARALVRKKKLARESNVLPVGKVSSSM